MEERSRSEYHGDEPAIQMLSDSVSDNDGYEEEMELEDEEQAPVHPIPSMQGPFEESIADTLKLEDTDTPGQSIKSNAKARRKAILDSDQPNHTYNAKWRATSDSKYHALTKVIAQVAFGIHLLHQELAKSDEEVVKILQRHVDEVDSFLQRTEEDLELSLADVNERITYLKLPLEHGSVFDAMLEDKQFRTSIIEGNDRIEKVVNRTARLMNDLHIDIGKTLESTKRMAIYLTNIEYDWPTDDSGSIDIYQTMQANAAGWEECLGTLQTNINRLSVALVQLGSILNEMAKRASAASRRAVQMAGQSTPSESKPRLQSPPPVSKYSRKKPLPEYPDDVGNAYKSMFPGKDSTSLAQKYENPRQQPPTPRRSIAGAQDLRKAQRKSVHRTLPPKPLAKRTPMAPSVSGPPHPEKAGPQKPKPERTKAEKVKPEKVKPEKVKPKKAPKSDSPKPAQVTNPALAKSTPNKSPLLEILPAKPHKRSKTQETVFRNSFLRNPLSSEPLEKPSPAPATAPAPQPPETRLHRARSRLRKKSQNALRDMLSSSKEGSPKVTSRVASPFAPDSAYSPGSNLSTAQRPTTAQSDILRKPPSFTLFPSTPSQLSLVSPPFIHSNKGSEISLPTALPPMPRTVSNPIPQQRRGSAPALVKRSSLSSLRAFFKREKRPRSSKADLPDVYELPA